MHLTIFHVIVPTALNAYNVELYHKAYLNRQRAVGRVVDVKVAIPLWD
jgi:hypothetical protein